MKKLMIITKKRYQSYYGIIGIAMLMILLSACANATESETEKQKVMDDKQLLQKEYCWTAVAATGILDRNSRDVVHLGEHIDPGIVTIENDLDLTNIKTYGGIAYLLSSKEGVYHIRYPINQNFVFNDWYPGVSLKSRYKVANKDRARVVIHLNRYNLLAPPTAEKVETILTVDSDAFAESTEFQIMSNSKAGLYFNFKEYGYYIDAQLINKESHIGPSSPINGVSTAVGLIQICVTQEIDVP